jgi:hypothetical protein
VQRAGQAYHVLHGLCHVLVPIYYVRDFLTSSCEPHLTSSRAFLVFIIAFDPSAVPACPFWIATWQLVFPVKHLESFTQIHNCDSHVLSALLDSLAISPCARLSYHTMPVYIFSPEESTALHNRLFKEWFRIFSCHPGTQPHFLDSVTLSTMGSNSIHRNDTCLSPLVLGLNLLR